MLVARRDPFHAGAQDAFYSQGDGAAGPRAGRVARTMSVLQIIGTLLAIPVGLGSAYSMYRANFSAEATCQSLRVNIVAVLDKSVDASTRHMLVRRDVEAFKQSCGAVDPDATAAFKALLADDKTAAPATTASVRRAEPLTEPVTRKAEPRAAIAAKQPAATTAAPVAETEPVKRDAADAVWLAAVRSALVSHERDPRPAATAAAAASPSPAVPARDMRTLGELRTPVAPVAAPALPPATSVAIIPAPQADADHPVPPASIPEIAAVPKEPARSRLGELVAQIPLVGRTLEVIDSRLH